MADALPPELKEFAALAERLNDPDGLGQQHIMAPLNYSNSVSA